MSDAGDTGAASVHAHGRRDIIEPDERDAITLWAHNELWDGMSDAGRAAWMTGYMIWKLRGRAPRARLENIIRTAVSVIDAAERLRNLGRGSGGNVGH